ncbi:MAG: hypothetical protein ABJN34_11985 [Litoreibacter sp.]|uniref:hypothetical protein n=1 Tax=Litoreibacter sp. TaxID=1969459 RepID=UPI00329822C8
MEICLHLGAHRTGSTGLQVLLNSQRAELRRAGVAYWGPDKTRNGLLAGLIKDPSQVNGPGKALGERSCGRLRMEFARLEVEHRQQLVISEENLIGTMAQNLSAVRLYGQAADRLARVRPAFEGRKLRIGLAIRAYDLHWASQLAFRAEMGASLPSPAKLDRLVTQPRRWCDLIADIKTIFPNASIVVWPFEGWVSNPLPLVSGILGREIPLGALEKPHKSNASATATQLASIAAERGDIDTALRLASAGQGARYMPFNADQLLKLKQDYRADISWLKANATGSAGMTYLDPTGGTFGEADMTEGSHHERRQTKSVGSTR